MLYRTGLFVRTRLAPILVFAATVGGAFYLYRDVGERGNIVGFAEGVQYQVAAVVSARVASIAVEVGQSVMQGQVIASLDPSLIDGEIGALRSERKRLAAEILATEAETRHETAAEARQLQTDVESAEVALAEARALSRTKAAELRALSEQRRRLQKLVEQRLADTRDLAELDVAHAALREESAEAKAQLALLEAHVESARARALAMAVGLVEVASEPVRRELDVVEQQIAAFERQREDLVLRAPTSGQVSAVYTRPGEVAAAGVPIATIVSAVTGRVSACVSEERALSIRVGDAALLWPRGHGGEPMRGHAVSLGPIVSEMPERCWPMPTRPAWGREVVIMLDEPNDMVAGQAFDVRLAPAEAGMMESNGALAAPPPPMPGDARAIGVPDALRARTRFEPSALVWLPEKARYIVVSDDTGQKDKDDHAPWLFAMDARGQVDAEPLAVEGLRELNDLESIARARAGGLYVLSSQSHSAKGKRKKSRQLFARLAGTQGGFRVEAQVALATLLDEAGPSVLAGLGLTDTRALNIEGMTNDGEGLLLGLKAPLDPQGRAIVWRMAAPDALLGGGTLEDAGLTLFGVVGLTVTAEGRTVGGGISDLLRLPDGTLLIASTSSGIKTPDQSGGLWRVPAGASGELVASQVQTFPGLKPEGLALTPQPGHLIVTFDTDTKAPLYLEMAWPR